MLRTKPFFIGLCNAVVPGLGYLILGERKVFGGLLLLASLSYLVLAFTDPAYSSRTFLVSQTEIGKLLEVLSYGFAMIAFGYDAWSIAQGKVSPTQSPS